MIPPAYLEVLTHCYASCEPLRDAPIVREAIGRFLIDGIIESIDVEPHYRTTDKGAAWLKAMLSTPYPKCVWVDSQGQIVGEKP